jgi:uncharacterized protein YggE
MRILAPLTLAILAVPAAAQVPGQPGMMLVEGTLLDVSATGRTSRVPDIATIRAGVVTQSATAAAALADNSARMGRVLAALKKAGVADRDIQTSNIGLQPQYRYVQNETPVITGYQATNNVAVRFRDIARAGTILDALAAQGANQIDGPNLSIDKPEAAQDEARIDAIAKARARAELYARAAGLTVSRILSISESGDFAPNPPVVMIMARASAPQSDTKIAAGEQDVTMTVSVRFRHK